MHLGATAASTLCAGEKFLRDQGYKPPDKPGSLTVATIDQAATMPPAAKLLMAMYTTATTSTQNPEQGKCKQDYLSKKVDPTREKPSFKKKNAKLDRIRQAQKDKAHQREKATREKPDGSQWTHPKRRKGSLAPLTKVQESDRPLTPY